MKFKVTMKDPDTLIDAVNDAVKDGLRSSGLAQDEQDLIESSRASKIVKLCGQWFRYSEYLTVEIDTDAGTCTVLPVDEN